MKGITGKFILKSISLTDESNVEIRNLRTANLEISNTNNLTNNFSFYDTEIISLEEYIEKSWIKVDKKFLEELKGKPNLLITKSYLGKAKFVNCDFSKAKHIKIESSYLTESKFVNVDFGKISEDRICKELFEKEPKKARDTYRQLKLALDNQKDHINANEFYSLEMKAYERYLKSKSWKDHFQEKLVFSIHRLVSNFGQSWVRPLFLLLIITLIASDFGLFESWKELYQFSFGTIQNIYKSELFTSIFIPLVVVMFLIFLYNIILGNFKKTIRVILRVLEISFGLILIILSIYIIWEKKNYRSFDYIADIINITKTFKLCNTEQQNEHLAGFGLIYTFYVILFAFLAYQFIMAIRRKVRR